VVPRPIRQWAELIDDVRVPDESESTPSKPPDPSYKRSSKLEDLHCEAQAQ